MVPIVIKKDDQLHSRFGYFHHNDMIGKEFGSKVY